MSVSSNERASLFFCIFRNSSNWLISRNLENEPLTGCNVEQSEWEGFYASTIIQYSTIRQRVFKPKMIFLPLELNELRKVPTLDQNPGWEK